VGLPVAEPVEVSYNPALPPDTFDVIIIDECHRSIYGLWRQVLEYFDAHLIGLTATLAPTIGPTLGGWLTETFSWHWLFLINVPFGILVATCVWRWMHLDKPNLALFRGFDWFGLALMALFLGNLEYVLEGGSRWNWFEDDTIVHCTVLAGVAQEPPYPPSRTIKGITWHWDTYQTAAIGSDLWPVTWGPDNHLYLAKNAGRDCVIAGEQIQQPAPLE